jgi:hypothetical protein
MRRSGPRGQAREHWPGAAAQAVAGIVRRPGRRRNFGMAERFDPDHTDETGMDQRSGNAHCTHSGTTRGGANGRAQRAFWSGLAATILGLVASTATSSAHASDYMSEILTPPGWEQGAMKCTPVEPAGHFELMTPVGWTDGASASDSTWGAPTCSELVVPRDWTAYARRGPNRG